MTANIRANESASKEIVPMKRLSGVKTGRRSFTGNFDGMVQEALKESKEIIEEDHKGEAGTEKETASTSESEERKFIPRASLRMSLAKASGRRSSITIGGVEVSSSKIDAMSTKKKPKVINFADVIGNKADGNYDGRAVRRDYSSAAGVIKRASKAGGASISQRHLPKFRPATVVVADDDEQDVTSINSQKSQYISPGERERLEVESKKRKRGCY